MTHWDTGGKYLFIFLKSHSNQFGFQKKKLILSVFLSVLKHRYRQDSNSK